MHPTAYRNQLGAENEGHAVVATRVVPPTVWGRTRRDDASRMQPPSTRRAASSRRDTWPRAQRGDLIAFGAGATLSLAALIGLLLWLP